MLPTNAHAPHNFKYSIKGTFSKNGSNSARVMVLVQAKARACASTEPQDFKHAGDLVNQTPESSSPFTLHARWFGSAQHPKPVRLCAYSYASMLPSLGKCRDGKAARDRNGGDTEVVRR